MVGLPPTEFVKYVTSLTVAFGIQSVIDSPAESPAPAPTPDIPAGSGSGVKNSNHWSVDAREDMFNRRASGEGWETICKVGRSQISHPMHSEFGTGLSQSDTACNAATVLGKNRVLQGALYTSSLKGR